MTADDSLKSLLSDKISEYLIILEMCNSFAAWWKVSSLVPLLQRLILKRRKCDPIGCTLSKSLQLVTPRRCRLSWTRFKFLAFVFHLMLQCQPPVMLCANLTMQPTFVRHRIGPGWSVAGDVALSGIGTALYLMWMQLYLVSVPQSILFNFCLIMSSNMASMICNAASLWRQAKAFSLSRPLGIWRAE